MTKTDANPPMMPYTDDYTLVEVDADYLTRAVKPKQFIHIDQTECIMCEGCVDICPWKCIHMVSPDAIPEADGTEQPGADPSDNVLFIIDDDICTRCALCVDRCPTGVIILGKVGQSTGAVTPTPAPTTMATLWHAVLGDRRTTMAKIIDDQPQPTMKDRAQKVADGVQGGQAWSIFRPGSIFRKGYSDSPRNRSYVIMNSVLYHLHPVKVKRHAVKVSYTLCLGGLSFFLFILLTVTGIFLMFFYRPTDRRPGTTSPTCRRRSRSACSCATCTDGART